MRYLGRDIQKQTNSEMSYYQDWTYVGVGYMLVWVSFERESDILPYCMRGCCHALSRLGTTVWLHQVDMQHSRLIQIMKPPYSTPIGYMKGE